MESAGVKHSNILKHGAEHVEQMRRALNGVYSEVPKSVEGVFSAMLDQIADQQVKVSQALAQFISDQNLTSAEQTIAAATDASRRSALRAAREYADHESAEAGTLYQRLTTIPANVTGLVERKRKLDETFAKATQLHEQDDIAALEPLLDVSNGYKVWCEDARLLIAGSQGLVKSDKKRLRLQWLAIIVALLLGIFSMALNVILNLRRK